MNADRIRGNGKSGMEYAAGHAVPVTNHRQCLVNRYDDCGMAGFSRLLVSRSRGKLHHSKLLPSLLCVPQVMLSLLVQPALGRRSEGDRQANSHFRADTSSAIQDGGERLAAATKSFRRLGHRKSQSFQAKRLDDLSRMGRIVHAHGSSQ